ncbi:hypothetical protein GCM10010349_42190 [Streptomyces flavofungini]|nr:hypothetical protein GCM10010349_42190 [Streptomyces flavofungini]
MRSPHPGPCPDGTRATTFDVMTAITLRIPDAMDQPLRDAAADAPSLNDYILRAVRRQMTLDAGRKLARIAPLALDGEGDSL